MLLTRVAFLCFLCRGHAVAPSVTTKKTTHGLSVGDELTLRIERLNNRGQGVGYVASDEDESRRFVVLVPFVIGGETCTARVSKLHKGYGEAELVSVVDASPERIEPLCPLVGVCGGCQYQHMTLTAQRDAKRDHVQDSLERLGGFTTVEVQPVVGGSSAFGYRSKLTPHFVPPDARQLDIGFYHRTVPRTIVDVPRCEIATEAINERMVGLREETKVKYAMGEPVPKRGATLLLRDTLNGVATDPNAEVEEKVGSLNFVFRAGEFFQNNAEALPLLVTHVTDQASRGGEMRSLVDAYCGGGLFALCGAQHFDEVLGIEISKQNVASANANAGRNGIKNARFHAGDAEELFAQLKELDPKLTAVVLDPPRKGASESFLKQLLKFKPGRIVYVSCEPATQARDAKFIAEGGYSLVDATPFDLFPQTRHIESVLTFDRAD